MSKTASISFSRKRQDSHEFKLGEITEFYVSIKVRSFDSETGETVSVDDRMMVKLYPHELFTQFPYLTRKQAEKLAAFIKPQIPTRLHFLYGIES